MKKYLATVNYLIVLLLSLALGSLAVSGTAYAETVTLGAIEDFPSVDDGEIAYLTDDDRGTLSVDVGTVTFDNQYARATTTFTGAGGTYEITLNTLGETAGDSEYRIMINGVIVGRVSNDPVTENYTEQQHVLTDVFVPAGAAISVESNSVSNGLTGEVNARSAGHWQSLTLQNNNPDQSVDLQISASVVESDLRFGDTFTLLIDIENASETTTATFPLVSVQIPETIEFNPAAECTVRTSSSTLTCELPEIGPQQSFSMSLAGTANAIGLFTVAVSINTDQSDIDSSNNRLAIVVDTRDPNEIATVDLSLKASASTGNDALETGQLVTYSAEVTNAHLTTVATAPVVEVVLPDNLDFQSSSDCILNSGVLRCELRELPPGAMEVVTFTVMANRDGNSSLAFSASAAEADDEDSNNELVQDVFVLSVAPALAPTATVTQDNSSEGGNSGGGSLSFLLLLPLVARRIRSQR